MIRNITTQQLEVGDIVIICGHHTKAVKEISSINYDNTYIVKWVHSGKEFIENLTYDERHKLWVD